MKSKKVLAGLILASSGLFAVAASAAIIPSWEWETDGGFVNGGSSCSNGTEAACDIGYNNGAPAVTPSGIAGTSSIMTWGDPVIRIGSTGQQSGLQGVFGDSGAGPYNAQALGGLLPITIGPFTSIITNGGWYTTGAAVHYNNIITTSGGYMDFATLKTTFELTAPPVGGPNLAILDIEFRETNNEEPCTFGNPHGTICDDVFTVTDLPPPIVFVIENTIYTLSFQRLAGPGAFIGGDTIWTAENAPGTAVMYIQARIDAREVPVPGVLALMGAGLLLLGWRTRARKDA
jgi:hypothetical protein